MSNTDNGGSAFPFGDYTNGGEQGMTLRDYFAAKAMAAIINSFTNDEIGQIANGEVRLVGTPKAAYIFADAMLEARKEGA